MSTNTDVLLLSHEKDHGYRYKNKLYSPLMDSLDERIRMLGYSTLQMLKPFSLLNNSSYHYKKIKTNKSFFIYALINKFALILNGNDFVRRYYYNNRVIVWGKYLKHIKPKLIIGIQPDPALCASAKELRIPVFDYQHGVVAINDWPYNKLIYDNFFTEMPTGFLCWDEYSYQQVLNWKSASKCEVYNIGNLWVDRFSQPNETDELVINTYSDTDYINANKPVILVSLQWGLCSYYHKDLDFNNVMCKALEDTILSTNEQYQWLLRLHPVQMTGEGKTHTLSYLKKKFSRLNNIEWEKTSKIALPVLLSKVDLHITDMSSLAIEADYFNIKTFLLNPELFKDGVLAGLFDNLVNKGSAVILLQNQEVIKSNIKDHFIQKNRK